MMPRCSVSSKEVQLFQSLNGLQQLAETHRFKVPSLSLLYVATLDSTFPRWKSIAELFPQETKLILSVLFLLLSWFILLKGFFSFEKKKKRHGLNRLSQKVDGRSYPCYMSLWLLIDCVLWESWDIHSFAIDFYHRNHFTLNMRVG